MPDLSVDFAGLKLKNPFVVASSELTNTLEKIKRAEKFGASAVSTKLCFLKVPFFAKPYHIVEKRAGFFSPSGDRLSVEDAQKLIDEAKRKTSLIIIANMMGPGGELNGWANLAKKLEDAGADMIEMNMSCPNIGLMAKQLGIHASPELGAALGQNPDLSREVTRAVARAVNIPVMAKMTPEANTPIVAQECSRGGAAAISAINCPQSLPGVDIYNEGRPIYPNAKNQSFAGLCGPWIRPLAYRHIAQIRMRLPDIPIAGGGGLTTWRHAVEMIMYGATVPTFCTLFYLKGFEVIPEIEKKLTRYMDEMGYLTLNDFRGIALRYIVSPEKVEYLNMIPEVNLEKCNGCGICTRIGHCLVINLVDGKAQVVREKECYGCGVCYWMCPRDAISMLNKETGEKVKLPGW
ncbi:tRNA-dihydrouridine synthase [Candidatus Aerophobetes bacterium]|nr:tRNA-dihydrouridine synthase [Candidatus Aerophobetes bacterium]